MSESSIDIEPSDLEKDSEIQGLELCSDGSGNWFVRLSETKFLAESGDIVDANDGSIPESAVYSSIIKSQQVAQTKGSDVQVDSEDTSTERKEQNIDQESPDSSKEENEQDITSADEDKTQDESTIGEKDSVFGREEDQDDTVPQEDSDIPKSDDESYDDVFEADENVSEDKEENTNDIFEDVVPEDPVEDTDEGIVSSIKDSLDTNEGDSPINTIKDYFQSDKIDGEEENLDKQKTSSQEEEDSLTEKLMDYIQSDEIDGEEGTLDQQKTSSQEEEDGLTEKLMDYIQSEDENQSDIPQNETFVEESKLDEDNPTTNKNNEYSQEESHDDNITEADEKEESHDETFIGDSNTEDESSETIKETKFSSEESQLEDDTSGEDSSDQNGYDDTDFGDGIGQETFKQETEEKSDLMGKVMGYFQSEEDSEENEKDDSHLSDQDEKDKSLGELIGQFISSDIADVDQRRPDAQNVSIDFIDRDKGENIWSSTMNNFWSKLRRARRGETEAKKDITADLWSRYKALVTTNTYARGDALDSFVGLFLLFVGTTAIIAGIISMLIGNVTGLEVLTQESTYGDHITLTMFILFITGLSFWLSRRTSSKTVVSAIQTPARLLQLLIVGLQMIVIGLVIFMLTLGGGQDALGDLEQQIAQTVIGLISNLPAAVSTPIVSVIQTYRGPESITGFSIVEASFLMAVVGLLIAYPVIKRSLARFVLTANMGAREFREETGILIEEISQGSEEFDEPDYILGSVTEEDESTAGTRRVTKEDIYDVEGEEKDKEGLIALPDHIKSSPFANYEEVRRYWVRAPYSYISIVYDERQNDYRYVVVEPELDESERVIFDELKKRLDNVLLFEDVQEYEDHEKEIAAKLKKLEKRMVELSEEYELDINDKTFHRLMYFVERDYIYYNKIDPLINDPHVEDISCDGEDQHLFVFHSDYKDVMTNVKFGKEELRSFVQELAQRSGEHISAADPMVDASLPDGSRAQMTLGSEVTTHGSTFTIRLFEDIPFTPVDLLNYDTFSMTQMAYLWTAIEHNKSLIFAGGTASGKTTSMNAVSMFIPPKAKVITIEDTREISLPQKNWIPGTTREGVGGEEGGEDIDMYELLRAALRQRPEYIVVGEIRGQEAETLFQAMNTGHTTYSTMHAETVDAAVGRLTNPPINVPKQMITALDIICIQNQIRFTDDEGNQMNVRRNEETREIVGLRDNGQFENRRPFQWDAETDNFIESLEDSHVLERVANENGWTPEDKRKELKQREEVLEYMLENDIREFDYVTNIIQAYMVDSEKIVREVRNDTLEPEDLKSLTDMEWETPEVEEPDTTLNDQMDDNEDGEKAVAEMQGDNQ